MFKGLILISLLGSCMAACDYKIKNIKYSKVDNNAGVTVDRISAKFNDDCSLLLYGCAKLTNPYKKLDVKYKGIKNGVPLITGSKKFCGFKHKDLFVNCPIKPPVEYCAKDWEFEVPKQALSMAIGKLTGVVELIAVTDSGKDTFTFKGEAEIYKK